MSLRDKYLAAMPPTKVLHVASLKACNAQQLGQAAQQHAQQPCNDAPQTRVVTGFGVQQPMQQPCNEPKEARNKPDLEHVETCNTGAPLPPDLPDPNEPPVRTCAGCRHRLPYSTCGEPVKAGLAPRFEVRWPPAGYAASCPAYEARTQHVCG